ncbi:retrovirus-related pol polyprotein from transposon TNT 1-94 [Tanacetum coccineum]
MIHSLSRLVIPPLSGCDNNEQTTPDVYNPDDVANPVESSRASLSRLDPDAVGRILTPSLVSSEAVTYDCDAVSSHMYRIFFNRFGKGPLDKDRLLGVKWVYKVKFDADGSVQRNKVRLVAKGYSQQPEVDYYERFAPVARIDTVRAIISLACQKCWLLYQLDAKSVFLNGELKEEVYVNQPQGFEVEGKEEKVYKLKKALYGLKQEP